MKLNTGMTIVPENFFTDGKIDTELFCSVLLITSTKLTISLKCVNGDNVKKTNDTFAIIQLARRNSL